MLNENPPGESRGGFFYARREPGNEGASSLSASSSANVPRI